MQMFASAIFDLCKKNLTQSPQKGADVVSQRSRLLEDLFRAQNLDMHLSSLKNHLNKV